MQVPAFQRTRSSKRCPSCSRLDRTLAADFENHARIGPRHVGITVFFRRKIPVGFGVGLGHIEGRHADAVSKFVDGDREVVLRERAQFGLGFGIDQQHFAEAVDGHIAVRRVHTVVVVAVGRGVLYELDGLVAGDGSFEHRPFDFGLSDSRVARSADALRQTRVAAVRLFDELHLLPAGFVGEGRAVVHQIGIDELAGEARPSLRRQQRIGRCVVARADRVVELDSQNVLFGTGVLLGEERQVVLFGVSGLIELVGALFDDFEGGLGSQIEVEVRIVAVEVEVVVFAVGSS